MRAASTSPTGATAAASPSSSAQSKGMSRPPIAELVSLGPGRAVLLLTRKGPVLWPSSSELLVSESSAILSGPTSSGITSPLSSSKHAADCGLASAPVWNPIFSAFADAPVSPPLVSMPGGTPTDTLTSTSPASLSASVASPSCAEAMLRSTAPSSESESLSSSGRYPRGGNEPHGGRNGGSLRG